MTTIAPLRFLMVRRISSRPTEYTEPSSQIAMGDFKFVPASLELIGNRYSTECYFLDHPATPRGGLTFQQCAVQEKREVPCAERLPRRAKHRPARRNSQCLDPSAEDARLVP